MRKHDTTTLRNKIWSNNVNITTGAKQPHHHSTFWGRGASWAKIIRHNTHDGKPEVKKFDNISVCQSWTALLFNGSIYLNWNENEKEMKWTNIMAMDICLRSFSMFFMFANDWAQKIIAIHEQILYCKKIKYK